jgi:LPS-assembly protein
LKYTDNLVPDNQENQFQELPSLSFDATRQAVGRTGLYFQMKSSYTYWWREKGSTGHISSIKPTVSLPLNFDDYLETEPSLTLDPRFFHVDLADDEDPDLDTSGATFRWNFTLKNSTYLYRVYSLRGGDDPLKVKHAFRPYLNYSYQPKIEDDDIASLARRSDQSRVSMLSYGINNSFTSKVITKDEETGEMGPVYREFMRINLFHTFDVDEYLDNKAEGEGENRPLGLLGARVEFDPADWVYLQTTTYWDPNKDRFTRLDTELTFEDYRGDSIGTDYTYRYDGTNQINFRLRLAINNQWALRYVIKRELDDDIDFEQTYGLDYEGQCWGVRAFYTDKHFHEQGYWLVVSLRGFGDVLGQGKLTTPTD